MIERLHDDRTFSSVTMEVSSATKEYATRISNENKPGHTGAMQLKWLTILCVLFSYGTVHRLIITRGNECSLRRSIIRSLFASYLEDEEEAFRLNNLAYVFKPC
jgi:hypothetical protein